MLTMSSQTTYLDLNQCLLESHSIEEDQMNTTLLILLLNLFMFVFTSVLLT
jgi:hypothetical protein